MKLWYTVPVTTEQDKTRRDSTPRRTGGVRMDERKQRERTDNEKETPEKTSDESRNNLSDDSVEDIENTEEIEDSEDIEDMKNAGETEEDEIENPNENPGGGMAWNWNFNFPRNKLSGFAIPILLLFLLMIYGWKPRPAAQASETDLLSAPDAIAGVVFHSRRADNQNLESVPEENPENPDGIETDHPDNLTINPHGTEIPDDQISPDNPENPEELNGQEASWKLRDGRIISMWADGDNRYVFLPAYAHMIYMTALVRESLSISLDGYELTEKSDLSRYAIGEPYSMRVRSETDKSYTCTLYFLRSANLPAMYIDTPDGTMNQIHADRDYRESVRVALVGADGTRLYSGVNDTLKGRGQSSWTSDKKSYSLNLQKPKGLLGMSPGVKWALVSNTYDHTSLRNKLVMDLAAKTNLEWTPSCEYIDLYLNGDYAGLYLLSERVENDVNRLNLPDNRRYTNFLCKIEIYNRWSTLDQPFLTDQIRTVELVSPKPASELDLFRVQRDVQLLENTILSGNEQALRRYLDIDSWVRRYLIDEISENLDADLASSYFYCVYNGNRPVFYGGPVWDYDATFDNASPFRNINPAAFVANTALEAEDVPTPWFHALYQYPVFYQRVCELYQSEFRPLLEQSVEWLNNLYDYIKKASEMNQIRWYHPYDDISPRRIQYFIMDRVEFLDQAWIKNIKYYTVQVEPYQNQYYLSYAVEAGKGFSDFPDSEKTRTAPDEQITWYDRETGIIYEPDRPIEKDTILVRWNPKPPALTGPERKGTTPVPIPSSYQTFADSNSNHASDNELKNPDENADSLLPYPDKTGGAENPDSNSNLDADTSPENPDNQNQSGKDPGSDPEARQAEEEKKTPVPWQDEPTLTALLCFEFLGVVLFLLIRTDARRRKQEELF